MSKRPRDTFPPPGRFVADADDIDCPICLDPFWNPTRAEPCGHVACRDCIGRLQQCPMCRSEVQSTTPCGASVSRRSHAARVSCPSCPWTGTRKQQITQAHVMCPVLCEKEGEEKMVAVMRDVYPRADFTRRSLLSEINKIHPDRRDDPEWARNWKGKMEVLGTELLVKEMFALYCPNLDKEGRQPIISFTLRSDVIHSLSGPASCLLWTLFDACSTSNTELAVGLALRALSIPPTSPDAFPAGLEWQFMCLLVAASSNHATLRELLRNGFTAPNPCTKSARDWMRRVIECSCKYGDFECLRLLVKGCPFIDFKATGLGGIMLRYAIDHDRSRWLQDLVNDFGCDVNAPSDSYVFSVTYPLFRAVEANKANCVSELIGMGANLNQANRDIGYTALHISVSNSDVECLNILLAAGADVNVVSRYGVTIVSLAAAHSSLGPMKALVAAGVDTNVSASYCLGDSEELLFQGGSICVAARSGNLPMVEYLHSLLPKPDLGTLFPTLCAEDIDEFKRIGVQELLSVRSSSSLDVVAIAVLHGHRDVVEFLVGKGYHVGIKAVHTAIISNNIALLEYALQPRFTQVLDEKWQGKTALQLAASLGDIDMVDMLLGLGATLDITAEEAAIRMGHIDVGYHLHQRRISATADAGTSAAVQPPVVSTSSQ